MISSEDIKAFQIPEDGVEDTIYLHSDKDTMRESFKASRTLTGLTVSNESVKNASYAAYEIAVRGYWNSVGDFLALEINGVPLSTPTKL